MFYFFVEQGHNFCQYKDMATELFLNLIKCLHTIQLRHVDLT